MANKLADSDHLFVCQAYGKTSNWRYGFKTVGDFCVEGDAATSPGWDESCMLNAVEVRNDRLVWNATKTQVVKILPAA